MTTKTVILSTDDNLDYISYLPYVQKAWNTLGWNTLTFYLGVENIDHTEENKVVKIDNIDGYKKCTVIQISRLFGYQYVVDGIIMTSDVDMMPVSDYWHPKYEEVTCYGLDLTNFVHYPICYIAANKENWKKIIPELSLKELLDKYHYAKSSIFNEYWFTDQNIVTERLRCFNITNVLRGFENGLAKGRIDRVNWDMTKNRLGTKIDAHMPRPFDKQACKEILNIL